MASARFEWLELDGVYAWRLVSAEGEVVARSTESYSSAAGAKRAIHEAVNATLDALGERTLIRKGRA